MKLVRGTAALYAIAFIPLSLSNAQVKTQVAKTTVVIAGVADAATGAPLEGAQVQIPEVGKLGRTNWIGEATLDGIPFGKQRIRVRKLGYTPADVDLYIQGDSVGPVFMLERAISNLDTVFVAGEWHPRRMSEFFARERMHIGRFIADSALAKEGNHDLAFLLANRIPGLRAVPDSGNPGQYTVISTRPQAAKSLGHINYFCSVDVYIDGFFSHTNLNGLYPDELGGVEYYSMESAPVQYRRSTGSCGVLLAWTKF
jgi:hypothetical protein